MLLVSSFLCTLLGTLLGAPNGAQALAPQGRPEPTTLPGKAPERQRGKLAWFSGSYEELLAQAQTSKRIVFIEFWTEWCPFCTKLEKVTLSSTSVQSALEDMLCYSVDANSKQGKTLARRFQARGSPTLVFLDPDGKLRDQLTGYIAPEPFLAELRRIKKNEGTLSDLRARIQSDPGDLEARWQLAKKLKVLGDLPGSEEQVSAIRERDPEGKTVASRRMHLEQLRAGAEKSFELKPLYGFAAQEHDSGLLFETWHAIWTLEGEAARTEHDPDRAHEHELRWFAAARSLWPLVPVEYHGWVGNNIAWSFYENRQQLLRADLEFALSVAEKAAAAAPEVPAVVDTLACCLFALDRREEALVTVQRCIELDPLNAQWRERLAEFQGAR